MPCYRPHFVVRRDEPLVLAETGELREWSYFGRSRPSSGDRREFKPVSCGTCIGCCIRRSRDWAIRADHHRRMLPLDTCWFLTLTFSNQNLPLHPVTSMPTFRVGEHAAMIKRLRTSTGISGIKFMGCREYGERTRRPHYHFCLFGLPLDDLRYYKNGTYGHQLFNSKVIDDAWQGRGHAVLAPLNFNNSSYVARYSHKKLSSSFRDGGLAYACDVDSQQEISHLAERGFYSNRPGLGHDFFFKHYPQLLALGHTVIGNHPVPLPKYYLRQAEKFNLPGYDAFLLRRDEFMSRQEELSDEALLRAEYAKHVELDRFVRSVI